MQTLYHRNETIIQSIVNCTTNRNFKLLAMRRRLLMVIKNSQSLSNLEIPKRDFTRLAYLQKVRGPQAWAMLAGSTRNIPIAS